MKEDQKLVRYSQHCQQRSFTQRNQSPYSHEERYQLDHKYITSSTFQRMTKNLTLSNILNQYPSNSKQTKKQNRELNHKLERLNKLSHLKLIFPPIVENQKKLYKSLINKTYSELNCMEIYEMMSVIDDKFNKQSESQSNVYQKCQRKSLRIQKDLNSIIETSNQHIKDTYNVTFLSFTESIIKKQQDSIVPSQTSFLNDWNLSLPKTNTHTYSQNNFVKKKNYLELSDQDNSEQNYYLKLQKQSKIKNKSIDPKSNNPQKLFFIRSKQVQQLPNVILKKNESYHQQPIINSEDNIGFEQQENQDKLNQTIRETMISIACHNNVNWEKQKFQKLEHIKQFIDKEGYKFDIKVKICKVLYHTVIKTGDNNIIIPKLKFIAGDQTGVAVFLTNYIPEIKIGAQLEMHDCYFQYFKGSPEIVNHKKFRIMNILQTKITVNFKKVMSNFIKQITNDLFYNIPDEKCYLIRHVAKKLEKNKTFSIFRMIVQIRFILNSWSGGIFCQAGDSSGLMMAYLKKQENMNYKQGDVLRLLKIKAQRGKQRTNLIQGDIIFIDAYHQQSKIYPFNLQFPSINEEIMS